MLQEKRVPFGTLDIPDKALIQRVVDSGWLTMGDRVKELEEMFKKQFDVKHAIACSTGTDALAICCAMLPRGKEVICPALTFVATSNAILQAGLKPVFVDVYRDTLGINWEKIEEAVTDNTVAIMPVHLMGKPAEMTPIIEIAERHGLMIIEDACEAHGAVYEGELVGTIGDMGCFSMYASHIVSSVEGGMIITNSDYTADEARSLRNHGIIGKFRFDKIGFSAKMNELEAAVGIGNMVYFEYTLEKRRENFRYLTSKFMGLEDKFMIIREGLDDVIGPHAFSIICKDGSINELQDRLDAASIDYRKLFYSIPDQVRGYIELEFDYKDYPEARYCSDNGIHVGIHQGLNKEDLDYMFDIINA